MDSLHWRNLNRKVKFEQTKKQYFNRYLWRLVYNIKKVSLASDRYVQDIPSFVYHNRYQAQRATGYSSYRREEWNDVDGTLVDRVRTVMNTFKDNMKFRCECHTMQIYAETEEDLKRVSAAISYDEGIVSINAPHPGTEDALRNGHVFMTKIDYKYKITLRDGNYDYKTKQSIFSQLWQRDDIKLPANVVRELGKKYPALWGAYFYSNDDSIVTILSLIAPGIVGKIHPIDHLQ